MVFVAWKIFTGGNGGTITWQAGTLGLASLIALIFNAPAPLVLLIAGLAGILIF
jgi:hypothetical protein